MNHMPNVDEKPNTNPIPNRFPAFENPGRQRKASKSILLDIIKHPNSPAIIAVIFVAILVVVAAIIITGLSDLGGGFGATVTNWFGNATIDPNNRKGFICFLKLGLTAVFIGVLFGVLLLVHKKG